MFFYAHEGSAGSVFGLLLHGRGCVSHRMSLTVYFILEIFVTVSLSSVMNSAIC